MRTDLISRLNHMRDLGPSEAAENFDTSLRMTDVLTKGDFRRLDTPVLEPTELFVRKSGGEVSSSLYSFQDPGGMSVSLRPEFTPSVIRWYIENGSSASAPHRYQYSGPVFRYAGVRRGRVRKVQHGCGVLIGASDTNGDVEILTTAARCLRAAGVSEFTLRLGHIGMIHDIVQAQGLSEQVEMFIISNLEEIGHGSDFALRLTESAAAAGLLIQEDRAVPATEGLDEAMPELEVIRRSISGPTGRRSASQILARLSSRIKRACSRSDFVAALDNVSQLVSLGGSAWQVIEDAEAILKSNGASLSSVRSLGASLLKLGAEGIDESAIHLDLSFVRGVTYYTGIVFEFLDGKGGDEFPIGGGGRYDDLVKAFGGGSVPACGFALYVDEVVRAIQQERKAT
ncbi:MAG: HisS family protein [Dehalococcoidia bacterium]|nr:HisS family protein [Dehalococcoidia bacterium]